MSLDAAGLVALADLTTIARRTALTGTSAFLDTLVLCPGLHRQQAAPELNGGEYPACAAMTTGYVFRVENPATVLYLQKVGRTGQLTTLSVTRSSPASKRWHAIINAFFTFENATIVSTLAYMTAVSATGLSLLLLVLSKDAWGVAVISNLIFARLCNVVIVRRRSEIGWTGASEPGVHGDLLVLLSQDRWIRIRGAVDDLKAITSGQWLRELTFLESSVSAFATVLVYLNAALASNVEKSGQVIMLVLLIVSVGLLAIANERTDSLQMHGNVVKVEGQRRAYTRRLELAEELIQESGRNDWAARMGMILQSKQDASTEKGSPVRAQEGVTL